MAPVVHVKRSKLYMQPLWDDESTSDHDLHWEIPVDDMDTELPMEVERDAMVPNTVIIDSPVIDGNDDARLISRKLRSRSIRS